MFIVPMTLFSCARRGLVTIESTTRRVSTIVSICAASTMRRISEWASETSTYSVRSSSTFGGRRSVPTIAPTSLSRSSACARRPPHSVDSPVMRTRRLSKPDGAALAQHVEQVLLDARADLVGDGLDQALVLPRLVARAEGGGGHGRQEADLELRRQVARHPEQAEMRERRRQRDVEQPGQPLEGRQLGEDRRGLLGADDGDRDQRRAGAHRRLDDPAAAEAPQLVAVLVELLRALAALGEDEHELVLV